MTRPALRVEAGRSGDRISVGVRISALFETGPVAHPFSYTYGYRVFPVVMRPGRAVDHLTTSRAEVKERVELYLYSLSGPSWPVLGWNFTFTLMVMIIPESLARPGRKKARKHVRIVRDFNNNETRAVTKLFCLQGKAQKEIHAILTETLACFLPGRTKDLSSTPVYGLAICFATSWSVKHSPYIQFPTNTLHIHSFILWPAGNSTQLRTEWSGAQ